MHRLVIPRHKFVVSRDDPPHEESLDRDLLVTSDPNDGLGVKASILDTHLVVLSARVTQSMLMFAKPLYKPAKKMSDRIRLEIPNS